MKKPEEEKRTDKTRPRDKEPAIRNEREKQERKQKSPDKELIEAQMKREAGDRNRTQTSYTGNIEVTALKDPSVHRETRSMPRTSKAVTDALIKKSSKKKGPKTGK